MAAKSTSDGWTESTGTLWKPEKKEDQVEGLLIDVQNNIGDNNSTKYFVKQQDNTTVEMWGSTILDQRMKGVPMGMEVRIVYKGLGDAKPGKQPPKLWQVFHREPSVE